ncbi:hypothetical protein QEJ31_00845 [Pigmentibacter sp. JX0631]|uniref:hypothetical protein n=1 Tax=Pigmentibacter sp. JX0631 TaxID=2976982 RepID=UPI0024696203|nr:hypothetical protein [Pigmentibacter sp. JX0631]WGL60150.1 hypothetical protein QEJ31_00845 [Pigmentibacter sp. JX0631]
MRKICYPIFFLPLFSVLSCQKDGKVSSNQTRNTSSNHTAMIEISNHTIKNSAENHKQNFLDRALNKLTTTNSDEFEYTKSTPLLGQGYNSNNDEYLSQCVSDSASDIEYFGQATTEPMQRLNMTYDQLNTIINGKASGNVSLSTFSANGEFEYSSNAQHTENNITFTNIVNFDNIKFNLSNPELSQSAYSLINFTTKQVSPIANDVCGNKFVSSITLGAKLAITVKISMNDAIEARNIGGKLDVNMPNFGSIAGYLNSLTSETAKNKSISIYIIQVGGDVSQLARAIPNNALKCSLDTPENRAACLDTLDALIKYQKSVFIPSVVNLKYETNNLHGLATTSTVLSDYRNNSISYTEPTNKSNAIILVSPTPIKLVDSNIKLSRNELANLYKFEKYIYSRTKELLSIRMNDYQKNLIQNIQNNAADNMKLYSLAGNSCYRDIENCIASKESAIHNAIEYDASVLDFKPILPAMNISGFWFNSILNISLNVAQIGINVDTIYTDEKNIQHHDYGMFTNANSIQADSESTTTVEDEVCNFNKKVVYSLEQKNNKNYLLKYERILENKCGIPKSFCDLPNEKLFQQSCEPLVFQMIQEQNVLNILNNLAKKI